MDWRIKPKLWHKKLILSAALTGAATNRSHCPYILFTPKELGEEAKRAVDSEPVLYTYMLEKMTVHQAGEQKYLNRFMKK